MRSVIACRRTSKVKCKHSGQPPCAACSKTDNIETCVLSGPEIERTATTPRPKRKSSCTDPNGAPTSKRTAPSQDEAITTTFATIPRSSFINALTTFQSQFPEFGFLHPDDLTYTTTLLSPIHKLRLLALLAVANQYTPAPTPDLAAFVIQELHKHIIASPSTPLIQTFLTIALYEWGECEGFSAWMHIGVAARMAQGILSVSLSYSGNRALTEIEKRTLWTCFVMDKLLSCGRRRKAMMHMDSMDVAFPLSDADFVFGQTPSSPQHIHGIGDSFVLIIKGLDIWSKIHGWTVQGGRKQPGMTEPDQCPWAPTSQWHSMKQELLSWRASQDPQLMYPETKAVLHVHLRQAEKFGYINLIYYISLLFLCREYVPFLPVGEPHPRGPIDPPLLKAPSPSPSFFPILVRDLYHATTQISNLLRDLARAGAPLQTPFTGLCAFSSALHSLYAFYFPTFMHFTPDDAVGAEEQAEESRLVLEDIGKVWKLAQSWIDVLDTARSLMSRVTSSTQGISLRSRSHYPELEDSLNLAPLKGMSRPTFDPTHSNANAEMRRQSESTAQPHAAENVEQPTFDVFESEFMDEGWRLASFWDDPHLIELDGPYWGGE